MLSAHFAPDGTFTSRGIFRFNQVTKANLRKRIEVVRSITAAQDPELDALSFDARKRILAFLKQETARFYGSAVRQYAGRNGEAIGSPLPQLAFEEEKHGAMYRRVLFEAGTHFRQYLQRRTAQQASPALKAVS